MVKGITPQPRTSSATRSERFASSSGTLTLTWHIPSTSSERSRPMQASLPKPRRHSKSHCRSHAASSPPDHIYIFVALVGLGDALAAQGHARQAETMLREGIEIGRRMLPKDDFDLALAERALGACLTRQRRFDEAELLLLGSYQILMANKKASPSTRRARQDVIDLYSAWGKPDRSANRSMRGLSG